MQDFLYSAVANAVKNQRWYQKNANTIVAGLVALSAVLSFVATLGLDLPPLVAAGIPAVVTLIGTMVTKLTKNGVQMSTLDKLAAAAPASEPRHALPDNQWSDLVADGYVGKHRVE